MLNKLAVNLIFGFLLVSLASYEAFAQECFLQLAQTEGQIANGICIANPIFWGNGWFKDNRLTEVMKYAVIAMEAGSKGDYNTALINFQRASQYLRNMRIATSDKELYQAELDRGYLAARLAKESLRTRGANRARQVWIQISGLNY